METKPRHSANVRRVSTLSARRKTSSSAKSNSASTQDNQDDQDDGHVRVAVRCRPMSDKELSAGYESIVEFEGDQRIVVHDVSEQPSDQLGTKSGERRNVSHVYDFDHVFDCQSKQKDIYDKVCRPIVDSVLEGYNGTIFAYGQTGTGKTYTMEGFGNERRRSITTKTTNTKHRERRESDLASERGGASGDGGANNQADSRRPSRTTTDTQGGDDDSNGGYQQQQTPGKDQAGIIPRTFEQIFNHVQANTESQFLIRASYLEVYQEEIRDLLRKNKTNKLELHERPDIGVYVKDLTSFVCKSIGEIERVMRVGNQNRIVGATDMNEHSSRSHAIFIITIEQQQLQQQQQQQQQQLNTKLQLNGSHQEGSQKKQQQQLEGSNETTTNTSQGKGGGESNEPIIRVGKLNLVDLAGSERQRKTNSFGQRQKESIKINSSLSALGNVINSLKKLQQRQQQKHQQQQQVTDDRANSTATKTTNARLASTDSAAIHTPYRDSKLTRLLQDSLGGNAKTLMIANIGPASYNYDETINTLNYASRARCIKNRPRLNEDPKDALLRELQKEIELLRAKLAANQQSSGGGIPTSHNGAPNQLSDNQSRRSSNLTATDRDTATRGQSAGDMKEPRRKHSTNSDNNNTNHEQQRKIEREFFELRQKLASLESKLLNSDKIDQLAIMRSSPTTNNTNTTTRHELDHQSILKGLTREQELELDRRQEELANQASRERAIRDELQRREEAEMMAKQSFESIQQEIDAKRRLIWQVLLKAKSIRNEIGTQQHAYRIELDELEQLQFVLQRELKLKCLIMDNFIPNDHVDRLISRVDYDERRNLCSIRPLEFALAGSNNINNNTNQCNCLIQSGESKESQAESTSTLHNLAGLSIRPRSEMERLSETINPSNIRYKYENLIEPNLAFINLSQNQEHQMMAASASELSIGGPCRLQPRRLCTILGERAGLR